MVQSRSMGHAQTVAHWEVSKTKLAAEAPEDHCQREAQQRAHAFASQHHQRQTDHLLPVALGAMVLLQLSPPCQNRKTFAAQVSPPCPNRKMFAPQLSPPCQNQKTFASHCYWIQTMSLQMFQCPLTTTDYWSQLAWPRASTPLGRYRRAFGTSRPLFLSASVSSSFPWRMLVSPAFSAALQFQLLQSAFGI